MFQKIDPCNAAAFVSLLIVLSGCASIQSQVLDNSKPTPSGNVYYVPRRPFVITVSTAASVGGAAPVSTVTAASGTAEPDMTKRFMLSQGTNLVARNEMNITIGSSGLLKTSISTATSELATALQGAAATFGTLSGIAAVVAAKIPLPAPAPVASRAAPAAPQPDNCPAAGSTVQYLIYPGTDKPGAIPTFCHFVVTWDLASGLPSNSDGSSPYKSNQNFGNVGESFSGIFYRHELPYKVTITGPATVALSVLTSPNESEIDFFPIKRSLFANNTADITITDGVITAVDQTTEGELSAAASLPANILSSYTTAVGAVFTGVTSTNSDQQKLLQQLQNSAATQAQSAICSRTIAANPITSSLDPTQLIAALAAIKAACPGS